MALSDYQALVDSMVRAPSGTTSTADRDAAIELARLRYSSDVPRELVEDVAWTADGYFGPLPAAWVDGSYLLAAEYPIGEQPPSEIDIAVSITPTVIQLASVNPLQAGAVVRVAFTAPHELTDGVPGTDTIPVRHREAVSSYAAHVLFKQIAAIYSDDRETPINADRSDTESRAKNFALRAKEARASYFAGIGKVDPLSDKGGASSAAAGGAPAASVSSWKGRERAPLTRGSLL